MEVHCSHCNKYLITCSDNDNPGTIAHHILTAGFIPKNTILYTKENEWLWFCSEECKNTLYNIRFSSQQHTTVREITNSLKAEIPQMVEDTVKATQAFAEQLHKLANTR